MRQKGYILLSSVIKTAATLFFLLPVNLTEQQLHSYVYKHISDQQSQKRKFSVL